MNSLKNIWVSAKLSRPHPSTLPPVFHILLDWAVCKCLATLYCTKYEKVLSNIKNWLAAFGKVVDSDEDFVNSLPIPLCFQILPIQTSFSVFSDNRGRALKD